MEVFGGFKKIQEVSRVPVGFIRHFRICQTSGAFHWHINRFQGHPKEYQRVAACFQRRFRGRHWFQGPMCISGMFQEGLWGFQGIPGDI